VKILVIAGRELGALLGSVVGWLVITAFVLISGVVGAFGVAGYALNSEQIIEQPWMGAPMMTYADTLLWPVSQIQATFLMFFVPGLTMRLFSEELRQRTLELLLTSPLSLWELVTGKFLGTMAFATILLALASWHLPLLGLWSDVDWVVLLCNFGGLWLVTACLVVLGMFFSASTPHQVVALVLAEGTTVGLLLLSSFEQDDPTGILGAIGLLGRMDDLAHGLLRFSDLTFFVIFIAVGLLATQQRIALRRWS